MSELITKAATSNDFEFCWAIYSDAVKAEITPHLENGWNSDLEKEKFKSVWLLENSHIILCDGEAIGWLGYRILNENFVVEHFYLKPDYQGRRIGSILLNWICEQAKKEGRKEVHAEVLKGSGAKSFGEKLGFSATGTTPITIQMRRSIL